jgi:hypothetical protein
MVLHRHCGLETMSQNTITTAANAGTPSQNHTNTGARPQLERVVPQE